LSLAVGASGPDDLGQKDLNLPYYPTCDITHNKPATKNFQNFLKSKLEDEPPSFEDYQYSHQGCLTHLIGELQFIYCKTARAEYTTSLIRW